MMFNAGHTKGERELLQNITECSIRALIPYMFVTYSSQMISSRLVWVFKASSDIKSTETSNLHGVCYSKAWMNEKYTHMR
jgi:hypothetical protein